MNLENLLAELGQRLGVGTIELDGGGGCVLAFDDNLVVEIEASDDPPGMTFSSALGPVPAGDRSAIFTELLEANLLGRGTGPASFGFDSDLDEIVLSRLINRTEIDIDSFEAELETFLQVLSVWRQRYDRHEIGNSNRMSDAQPPEPGMTLLRG